MFERCLYFNTNTLVRKVNRLWDEHFIRLGLSPSHAYLIRVLTTQGTMTQKKLAETLQLEKSTVTRFIDALSDKGYVVREKVGREQHIIATHQAKQLADQLNNEGEQLYKLMEEKIGKARLEALVAEIREVSSLLE